MSITVYPDLGDGCKDQPDLVKIGDLNGYGRLIGSEYINGKPGRDRDIVFCPNLEGGGVEAIMKQVEAEGFTITSEPELYPEDSSFFTARKGEFNLIMCTDWDFFHMYVQAAEVCRMIVLYTGKDMDKGLRVAIHKRIADLSSIEEALEAGRILQVKGVS